MAIVYMVICAIVRLARRQASFDGAVTAEYEVPRELIERSRRL